MDRIRDLGRFFGPIWDLWRYWFMLDFMCIAENHKSEQIFSVGCFINWVILQKNWICKQWVKCCSAHVYIYIMYPSIPSTQHQHHHRITISQPNNQNHHSNTWTRAKSTMLKVFVLPTLLLLLLLLPQPSPLALWFLLHISILARIPIANSYQRWLLTHSVWLKNSRQHTKYFLHAQVERSK